MKKKINGSKKTLLTLEKNNRAFSPLTPDSLRKTKTTTTTTTATPNSPPPPPSPPPP